MPRLNRRLCSGRSAAAAAIVMIAFAWTAMSAPPVPAKADPPARPMDATLTEVAVSIRRFEEVFQPERFNAEEIESLNLDFDRVVTSFFRGRYRSALEEMDALTARLHSPESSDAFRALLSLGVEFESAGTVIGEDRKIRLRLASLYPAPESVQTRALSVELSLSARDNGETVWREPITIKATDADVIDWRGTIDLSTLEEMDDFRTFDLNASCEGAPTVAMGMITIGTRSFLELRRELEASLNSATDDGLTTARDIARSRCAMLVDRAEKTDLTRWIVDRAAIANELRSEIESINAGVNPYVGRVGDLWCSLPLDGTDLPCRLLIPSVAREGKPLPIVIALHGAGGNEHMFFEAYGVGMLPQLAEEHGFIAVAPLTYSLFVDSSLFPALLEVIDAQFAPIDRDRVYVLGHSMGAMTAVGLASAHGDAIAAVVPIAGNGRMPLDEQSPPCRAYTAEHDSVLNPDSVRRGVESIKAMHPDAPIEFHLVEGTGHMLIVNQVLDEVINWLLAQRR